MAEGSFTNEYPAMKKETAESFQEAQIKEVHDALLESENMVTTELLESITRYFRSNFEATVFPLDPALETGVIPFEECEAAPILKYPGMFTLSYKGKIVGILRETPEIKQ